VQERVRLMVNRHNSSANEISLEEVERTLGLKIFWKLGNDYETVIRSINTGEPLILDRRGSAFAAGPQGAGRGDRRARRRHQREARRLAGIRRLFGVRRRRRMASERPAPVVADSS
jgi:septum formation inhibitor-activating ATPase MinD